MIKQLLKLSLFLLPIGLLAQTQPAASARPTKDAASSRWTIALTTGAAVPVGGFAGIHSSWSENTRVSTGGSLELSGAYHIWRCFSAAAAFNGQFNRGNGIPNYLSQAYAYDKAPGSGVFGKDWQMTRFLAGGLFTVPISKKTGTIIQFRALAGIQKTRTPAFSYPDPNSVPQYSTTLYYPAQSLSTAFAYQFDAGVQWKLRGNWAFLVNAGYDGCRPPASPDLLYDPPNEFIPGPLNPGPYMVGGPQKTKLPTGTIFFRAGIAYKL